MAEGQGLNVVHADHVARLAERVAKGVGGGRYFCSCASIGLRARIEEALASALGGAEHVVRVDVSAGDPWNTVRLKQIAEGLPTARTVYAVHGLEEAARTAAERGAKHPYQQLNFARDGLAGSGTHLLVWLENVRAFDAFAQMAPDLWTYRTEVVAFVGVADFALVRAEPTRTTVGERLARVERELALPGMDGLPRVSLLDEQAVYLCEYRRPEEALRSVEEALRLIGRRYRTDSNWMRTWLYVGIRHVGALRDLSRLDEAWERASIYYESARDGAWRLESVFTELLASIEWYLGWGERARNRRMILWEKQEIEPVEFDVNVLNLRRRLCEAGRLREAAHVARRSALRSREPLLIASEPELQALFAKGSGDFLRLLTAAGTARDALVEAGGARGTVTVLTYAGYALDRAGLSEGVDRVWQELDKRRIGRLPRAANLAWRAAVLSCRGAPEELNTVLKEVARLGAAGTDAERIAYADALLEEAADAFGAGRHAMLTCALGIAETSGAKPHRGRALYARARALAGLHRFLEAARFGPEISNWSRDHRGPGVKSDVRRLLSEVQLGLMEPRRALALADAAVASAREDQDNYRIVKAHEARSRALVALNRVPEARAALEDALAVVRPEGLRPVEVRLLHEIAELPSGDDRADIAREALLLAKELMFPREEARALLNLARLGIESDEPPDAIRRWIDRAAMWTEALGPVNRLDTIRELRDRLASRPAN